MLTDEQWQRIRESTDKVVAHAIMQNAIADEEKLAVEIRRSFTGHILIQINPTGNWDLSGLPQGVGQWCKEAFELGKEHARTAATWVTDGNEDDESRRNKLRGLQNGDPAVYDYLPEQPNLSGEYAEDYNTERLLGDIGATIELTDEQRNKIEQAYLDGVVEEYELACEKELIKWLEPLAHSSAAD